MQSSKKSSLKPERVNYNPLPKARYLQIPLLACALLLGGCIAVDETHGILDEPLGGNYEPVAIRQPEVWPHKILVLPVSGQVHDDARAEFERQFWAELQARNLWVLVGYDGVASTDPNLGISEEAALLRARELGADGILQVSLGDEQIYSPIRISADVVIEDVASRQPAFKMHCDYDSRNKLVATSARRYYISSIQPTDAPDKSLSILSNRYDFLHFTGYYTARLVAEAFAASKKAVKAEAVPATPPPADTGGETFAPIPGQPPGK